MVMSHVGIDVSKDRLDVHVLPEGEAFAVARDGKGLAELVERMRALGPERIALEATGGFETVVAAALAGAALPVIVVNPAQARHFAQAIGQRAKTDPIDACMIARFVEATKTEVRKLPDEATQLLASPSSQYRRQAADHQTRTNPGQPVDAPHLACSQVWLDTRLKFDRIRDRSAKLVGHRPACRGAGRRA